jgi:AcrR family transcriptional regulator
MGRPKEHGEETRERLLETASRLLAEEGANAVSVRRLADEAGTSTRAIYSLFGSKEGLLSAMFRRAADTFVRLHDAVPVADDPLDELIPLGLAYRQSALEQPHLYGLLFGGAVPGFRPREEDVQYAQRSQFRVVDALERAARKGLLVGDPWQVSNEGWGLVHGLASLELMGCLGPPEAAEAVWRGALATTLAGLRQMASQAVSS